MKKRCFVHSGRGRSLCSRHSREARTLAAKWQISKDAAALELRAFEHEVEDARRARARELEAAIRTIQEHGILKANRKSTSKRKRARS